MRGDFSMRSTAFKSQAFQKMREQAIAQRGSAFAPTVAAVTRASVPTRSGGMLAQIVRNEHREAEGLSLLD